MKKIEKNIQNASKKLDKLSNEKHYKSDALKTLASSLDAKLNAVKNDLKIFYELLENLETRKKKLNEQKSEIKSLMNELKKLSVTASKELIKGEKEEKKRLKTVEKNDNKTIIVKNKKDVQSEIKTIPKKNN